LTLLLLAKLWSIKFGTTFVFVPNLENAFILLKIRIVCSIIWKIKRKMISFSKRAESPLLAHLAKPARSCPRLARVLARVAPDRIRLWLPA
jgi:hypothetical protein